MKIILIDAIHCFIIEKNGSFQIFKEMQDLLETFPNKKIILTNANNEQIEKYGLNSMPYEVFTLKHNPDKTDPKYYEILLNHFRLNKDNVIYFEHSQEAVKSAFSAGIKTYYYDKDKKDLDSLKKFLNDNL